MELQLAELALESLDGSDVEAAVLFIVDEDRPLRGLAGLCDWRLCGALSRALAGGWYQGKAGETLLMPSRLGRRAMRVFVFGLGSASGLRGAATLEQAVAKAFVAVRKAKLSSCCLSLPFPGQELDTSLELWAQEREAGPERQLLLGDVRQMQRWIDGAGGRLPGLRTQLVEAGPSLRGRGPDGTISSGGRDRSEP